MLQKVKDEVQRKRLQLVGNVKEEKLVYMKPLDHEEFCRALGRVAAFPVDDCPPTSPTMVSCSVQPILFPVNGREEPIRSANPIP